MYCRALRAGTLLKIYSCCIIVIVGAMYVLML